MNTKLKYRLEDLWNFNDKQILQILKYFKYQSSNSNNNRLDAIILSYENDLLVENDIPYVESERFDELFLLTDEKLKELSKDSGYIGNYNHVDMIRFIIDNDVKIVDTLPSQIKEKIEIYQINKDLYVCGVGTFSIRDKLKSMNGRWDAKNKCWILPLIVKSELLVLVPQTNKSKIITQIHPNIPIVNQIPTKVEHGLQAYQIDNNILICGKKTYDLKDELKSVGGEFNGRYKCWSVPHNQIDYVLELVDINKEKYLLERQRIQEQKTLTRLKNLEIENEKRKENLILQKRLEKDEPELPYVDHYKRLSKEELNLLKEKYDIEEIIDMMEKLDVKELKEIWQDKIIPVDHKISEKERNFRRKHDRGNYKYVTYTGNYRPSDLVLEYYANHWYPIPIGAPGYSVKRVDYKIYEIYEWSTD